MYFHWAHSGNPGSEHTVNKQSFPAEIQIYGFNSGMIFFKERQIFQFLLYTNQIKSDSIVTPFNHINNLEITILINDVSVGLQYINVNFKISA